MAIFKIMWNDVMLIGQEKGRAAKVSLALEFYEERLTSAIATEREDKTDNDLRECIKEYDCKECNTVLNWRIRNRYWMHELKKLNPEELSGSQWEKEALLMLAAGAMCYDES
ncbi:MAG: hypothetical protein ACXABY_36410 [Candidatus Thorarchaeota archaeon]|jgi:hypothetical protein